MQASRTALAPPETELTPEAAETAAKLAAMFRYLFANDGGAMLRAMEESGLSFTQCKTLFLLPPPEAEPLAQHQVASQLGVSVASVSRAVDGLVRKRLATRVEDKEDRRVKRVSITARGEQIVGRIVAARMAGLERFAATLTATERRKLDAALDALLTREDIAQTYEELKELSA